MIGLREQEGGPFRGTKCTFMFLKSLLSHKIGSDF